MKRANRARALAGWHRLLLKVKAMKMSDRREEKYLGDGLYASFDGYQIWLRAPRAGMDHEVALEPSTYEELLKYVSTIHAERDGARSLEDKQS